MNKKYLIFVGLLLVAGSLIFLLKNEKNSSPGALLPPAIVVLDEVGFNPSEITILPGQRVTFQTTRGKIFWPASDPHPTHDILSNFDPQLPIESNASWTFTFDEVGSFKYHDHLAPSYRGLVHVVVDTTEKIVEIVGIDINNCNSLTDKEKAWPCWDGFIREAVKSNGTAYVMNLLPKLVTNPTFAAQCHSFAHTIGNLAYLEFKNNKELDISTNMNYCGFAFYHGFMEGLFERGGNIQEARDLCEYVEKKANNSLGATIGACFHGIGHGVVDGSNKKDWGNAQALVDPGLKLCDKVAVDGEEHNRCYSGAFNSLSIAYRSSLWGLVANPNDPLEICRKQEEKYKLSCYSDMAVVVMGVTGDDFVKAVPFAERIVEDKYAIEEIRNLAGLKISVSFAEEKAGFISYIAICQSVQPRLVLACIQGFGSGLVEFHIPGNNYDKPITFCSHTSLSEEEKFACFKDVLFLIKASVKPDEFKTVCQEVDSKYHFYFCKD